MAKGKKTGGRQKGTPNLLTRTLEQKAAELGMDFFEALTRYAMGDWKGLGFDSEVYHQEKADGSVRMGYSIPPDLRLKAVIEGCQYLYPKRRAVELSTKENEGLVMIFKDYTTKKNA